ncbi:hypothetical protein Tcan_17635 [Toxocara canis]|uniref:Uncharacterized protein n=1 Tax=Toxocara canis TaxID=6265 RepID=A0A0B2VBL4_TOXCA|nr:hypothetical protein Tcan_17635 [Toxocara canis]
MSEESTSTTTTTEEATKGREENSSREYSSGKLSIATQALRSATEQQSQSSDEPSVYLDFSMRKHSTKMLCLMSMRRNDGSSQEHNEGMTRRYGQTDNQRRARQESEKGKQRINCCIESDIQLPVLKSERETMFDAQLGPTGVEAPENNRTKSASTERNEYMAEKKPEAKNKVMNSRTESKRKANEQLLVTEDESRERERRMKIASSVNIKKAVELAKSDNGTTENNDSGVDGPNMQNGTRRKKPDGVDLSIGKLASCADAGNKVFSNEKFDLVVDLPRNETFHPKEEEPGSAHRGNYAMPTAEKIQPPSKPRTEKNSRRQATLFQNRFSFA